MDKIGASADFGHPLRAFVLCGGLGTRLRSVLSDRPKSMALIGNVPFLQLLLEGLKSQGVQEVILGTGYRADQIEDFFRSGEALGIRLHYSREDEPLGTGGALKLAEELLSDPVVVLNGDSYVEWSLPAMADLFREREADIVMVLQEVPDVSRYGSVTIDADGRVAEFVEKGSLSGAGLINAGIYLLRKGIVTSLAAGSAISLERDVFPKYLGEKFFGLVSRGTFIDIGIPADLERAQTVLRSV
ncbi:MAG: nucleotidyltransferase family protein [Chthoniobacterales bacterium]